ncbi:MAG: endonuclease III domain-containing protein [Desulfocurvibacter africanus]
MSRANRFMDMYQAMLAALGPSGWWPGETSFEVAVGAVLTQNTSWANVEKAMATLRAHDLLTPAAMLDISEAALAEAIRPAGYYRIKAGRLANLLRFLRTEAEEFGHGEADLHDPALPMLQGRNARELRERLLTVRGIGPETADSILLYALGLPMFVVDAYTARIALRHGLAFEDAGYHELQDIFTDALPEDAALFNEYHALLVRVGHEWCRKKEPRCRDCPLAIFLD